MYQISDDEDITTRLINNFMEEFKEEQAFTDYFLKTWCCPENSIGKIM